MTASSRPATARPSKRLVPGSELRTVESPWGHYGWGMTEAETRQVDGFLNELLAG